MRTIEGLFDTRAQARRAVEALEAAGIPSGDISIIANQADADDGVGDAYTAEGAGTGAALGAVAGGGAGLLAGLGLMAIPGLGPVVAAGWLAATAAGAVAGVVGGGALGGLIGSLVDAGVPEERANIYAEGVRRGGTLVVARVDESQVDAAASILGQSNPVDPLERRRAYEAEGWREFDPGRPPYTPEEVEAERFRYRNVP